MQFTKLFFRLSIILCAVVCAYSCKKPAIPEQSDGKGSTIVRIPSTDGFRLAAIDLVSTSQTFGVLDVYRDAQEDDALATSTKVVITEDPSIIAEYNAAHGTNYVQLPASAFAIDPSNPKVGNDYALTFNAGEFYKQLKITVPDAAVLNPNVKYALAFRTSSVENGKSSATQNEVLVEVGVKNKWDGIYRVTGTLTDAAVATISGYYPLTWELRTTGANTLAIYDKSQGTQTHLITSSGSVSQYGSFGLNFTIDPATNKLTSIVNSYGQPSANGRSAMLDPSGANQYDPATKTFRVKYFLLQPGTTVRTSFDETWVFSEVR